MERPTGPHRRRSISSSLGPRGLEREPSTGTGDDFSPFRLGSGAVVRSLPGMEGYEVIVQDLVDAGQAGRAISEAMRGVDLGAPVRTLASALPGGGVAQTAAEVERMWTAAVTGLAEGMARHADAMAASATAYAQGETAAMNAMSGVG